MILLYLSEHRFYENRFYRSQSLNNLGTSDMTNLSRFQTEDGIELVIDTNTGEAFATQAGYCRMADIAKNTLSNRLARGFQGVHKDDLKQAEILTDGGVQGVHLIPADIVFDWLWDDKPQLARAMGKVGATVYIHKLAGFKVTSDAVATSTPTQQKPVIEQAKEAIDLAERYKALFGGFNPSIEQSFKDLVGNALIEANKQLPGSTELWMGVVNFAELELGFTVPKKGEFRNSALGTWIRFYYPELSTKQERRLCNETQQEIWVYPIHEVRETLETAVRSFFNDSAPGTKLKLEGAFKRNK